MKQEVWWVQFLIKVWVIYIYKAQDGMHAPVALQNLQLWTVWLLNYVSKLRLRGNNLFGQLLKQANKMHNR